MRNPVYILLDSLLGTRCGHPKVVYLKRLELGSLGWGDMTTPALSRLDPTESSRSHGLDSFEKLRAAGQFGGPRWKTQIKSLKASQTKQTQVKILKEITSKPIEHQEMAAQN